MTQRIFHKYIIFYNGFILEILTKLYYNSIRNFIFLYIRGGKRMSVQSKIDALQAAREEICASKAHERLTRLFDDGVFTEIDSFARSSSGYAEVVAGRGNIGGIDAGIVLRQSSDNGLHDLFTFYDYQICVYELNCGIQII